MPMEMIRKPRAAKRVHPVVMKEIRAAYKVLGEVAIGVLAEDVKDWNEKPEFKYRVVVSKKRWMLELRYDRRTRGGKRYRWVDEGTGIYGKKKAPYKIQAVNAPVLRYKLPSVAKTMPYDGVPAKSTLAEPATVVRKAVMHPGIKPRNFSKELLTHMKSRHPGSFINVTEAAVKRALRSVGLY